jgi:NAD(P)-dependent dehydrogenase (short-subunit alcohol dehydrogenase family)
VIATCRTPETATALQDLIKAHGAHRLFVFPLDVTDHSQHIAVRESLRQHNITAIDIVIANAGVNSVGLRGDPATSTPEPEMHRIFQTNVVGVMHTLQTLQDLVMASPTKLFVVLSSILGSIGNADNSGFGGYTAYRVSKAALNMFSVCFANDPVVQGSKMICLHPGWVQTDMGGAGGRKADIEVDECTDGILRVLDIATNVATNNNGVVEPQYEAFHNSLKSKNTVYVDFKGDILPW